MKATKFLQSCLVALATLNVANLYAQEKASPAAPASSLTSARVEPGLPGKAPKTSMAPRVIQPSDPKMTITSAPAVSMVERAETTGLQALDAAADLVAPWSTSKPGLGNRYVFGKDDRVQVTNTTAYPYCAIVSLEMTFPNGQVFIGSGCFISYQTVLTAGHCVYDRSQGGWARSIKVMPGRNGNSLPFGYGYAAGLNSVTGWTSNGDRAYDYGAIRMPDRTLGNRVGYFGYFSQTDSYLKNQSNVFNTAGYPGDKGGTKMYFTSGQISNVSSNNLYYYFDIMGGQSGSPIWSYQNGNRYVIGIVTAEYRDGSGPNIGTRVNTSVFNFIKSLP